MELEVKSAKAAGQIQFAINLLNPRLNQFIQTKEVNKEKTDFNQSVQFISRKVKQFFPNSKNESGLRKCFRRANEIRNEYSHQNFDINQFEHDVECLAKIASYIGAKDVEQKILALISLEDASSTIRDSTMWLQLKDEGNKHYKNNEWTEAMNCYTKAIRLNPKEATLYSNRALCEIQLSKFQLACEDAEDAIDLDSTQIKFYRILSEALIKLSHFEEALNIAEVGLLIDQRDEVLLTRQRDCKAMKITEKIDFHPVGGGLQSLMEPGLLQQIISNNNRTDLLPEDFDVIDIEQMKIKLEIAEAHKISLSAKGNVDEERKAFAIFESAAQRGNADGMYNVSVMYLDGKAGLPRDFLKAREYCEKAAAQKPFIKFQDKTLQNVGVAEAENCLGIFYRDGVGVDPNDILSFQWFLKSAQHDCSSAQNNLGAALRNGRGCNQNLTSARAWFEKAAKLGQSEGRLNLANMLIKGEGGPVDTARAAKLLKEAADQGLPGALEHLQLLIRSGAVGGKSMNDSKKLIEERAKKEDREAIFLLGLNYIAGTGGVVKDFNQAEILLRRACELNHPQSYLILGKLLSRMKKFAEAFHFIHRAAEVRGDEEAQWLLGHCFAFGQGCERDEHKSQKWLNKVRRRGHLPYNEKMDHVNTIIKVGAKLDQFETEQNLTNSGMSYDERLDRMKFSKIEFPKPVQDVLIFLKQSMEIELTPNITTMKSQINDWMPEMLKRAKMGSKTAERFFQAQKMAFEAIMFLKTNKISRAFCLWRIATTRLWDVIQIPVDVLESFYNSAIIALDKNSNDAEALFIIGDYNFRNKYDKHDQMSIALRCIELDPTIPDYHARLGSIQGFRGEFEDSYRSFERALELEPYPEWFYNRATSLRLYLEPKNPPKIIRAYQEFLTSNPPDSRKVPESYYAIGSIYMMMGEIEKAEEYYNKGLKSEQPDIRLSCFEPVKDSYPPKCILASGLEMKKMYGVDKMKKSFSMQHTDEVSYCENCSKEGVFLKCGRCRIVKYCNRDCQKTHWKNHKKICF